MAKSKWTAAVFQGTSSYLGPQQGETYLIQAVTPGQTYPFQVFIQELPGCTDEYVDAAAVRRDWAWQLAQQEGGQDNG